MNDATMSGARIVDKPETLDWPRAYRLLGITRSDMRFDPPRRGLFDVYVLRGVTLNRVIYALRSLGTHVQTYAEDLGKVVIRHDRDTVEGPYKITFRANAEADADVANHSALDLSKAKSVYPITLFERLLLELAYFLGTGEHLDRASVTLCAGSRDVKGRVPRVSFIPDCHVLKIDLSSPEDRHASLRARLAIP